jgi:hypothetical protein
VTVYGDAEPEDAWHPDDPVDVLLDNLCRRCGILGEPRQLAANAPPDAWLEEIRQRLARIRARRDELTDDQRVRVAMIAEDIEHVANRLRNDDG